MYNVMCLHKYGFNWCCVLIGLSLYCLTWYFAILEKDVKGVIA